jgi:hypothetical protein
MNASLRNLLQTAFCYIFFGNYGAAVTKGTYNEMNQDTEGRKTNGWMITHVAVQL